MREAVESGIWGQLGVSAAAITKLRAYQALVEKWTPRINLISKASIPDIWARHIEDSALLCLSLPENPAIWADLGSGGGFPGVSGKRCGRWR